MSVEKWESYIGNLRRMEEEALAQIRKFDKSIQDARSDSAEVTRFKTSRATWEEHLGKIREKIRAGENSIEEYKAHEKEPQRVHSEKRGRSEITKQQEPYTKIPKREDNNNGDDNVFDDESHNSSSTVIIQQQQQQQQPLSVYSDDSSVGNVSNVGNEEFRHNEMEIKRDCDDDNNNGGDVPVTGSDDINSYVRYAISYLSFIESSARVDNSNILDIETLKNVTQ